MPTRAGVLCLPGAERPERGAGNQRIQHRTIGAPGEPGDAPVRDYEVRGIDGGPEAVGRSRAQHYRQGSRGSFRLTLWQARAEAKPNAVWVYEASFFVRVSSPTMFPAQKVGLRLQPHDQA